MAAKLIHLTFIHPLSKYPGPFLAKFTDLYAAYHGWKGDIHLDMYRCHQKYGKHVRYGPNKLLINTAEALHDIHGTSSAVKPRFQKAKAYIPLIHRSPNTLTILGGKDHGRRRRLMAQGVSEKAQRGYEDRLLTHIQAFCNALYVNGKGQHRDMSQWCYHLSFDIMSDIVFSARYNLLDSKSFQYVTKAIDASNRRMSTFIQFPALAKLKTLDKYFFKDALIARNRFIKFVMQVVRERLQRRGEASDIFAHLAAAKDPETGEGFSPNEIHAESTTLIVAGSDTSSTALAGLFFYLATNETAYRKAVQEVRSTFSSRAELTMGPKLAACTYLRACVDESLRMSPPVGGALWRETMCPLIVDTETLPPGCDVGVGIYSIHHNDDYFQDPCAYRPERWLAKEECWQARKAFNPFSLGMRGCLGKGLAMTEMMLTMAMVLFVGDFRIAGGEIGRTGRGKINDEVGREREGEYQLWDFITAQKNGPVLVFEER
ncbi:cytochrome P450 3A31 [Setomelanomma holmii]|uniref:Cytochrome P450 3A31 n=1 Tax=Setomelanomma holmii TaxID=210430 RepID=A0A9P4HDP8_9PLEO|nr:cytochrome P450 3A31 [Setomelanomma holmii]